jgi:hypothetical protein
MTPAQLRGLPAVLDVATTARALGVSEWTVRELDRRGDLPALRLGRLKRWRLVDVLELLGLTPENSEAGSATDPATATAADTDLTGARCDHLAPALRAVKHA